MKNWFRGIAMFLVQLLKALLTLSKIGLFMVVIILKGLHLIMNRLFRKERLLNTPGRGNSGSINLNSKHEND